MVGSVLELQCPSMHVCICPLQAYDFCRPLIGPQITWSVTGLSLVNPICRINQVAANWQDQTGSIQSAGPTRYLPKTLRSLLGLQAPTWVAKRLKGFLHRQLRHGREIYFKVKSIIFPKMWSRQFSSQLCDQKVSWRRLLRHKFFQKNFKAIVKSIVWQKILQGNCQVNWLLKIISYFL